MHFTNKIIWITGASSGIGKALAIELANNNAFLILSSRKKQDLAQIQKACKNPENVKIVPLDLEKYDKLEEVAKLAIAAFGRIDILVNNAGVDCVSPVEEMAFEDWRRIMSINVDGVFLGVKTATPLLAKTGAQTPAGSSIINISSIMGKIGYPDTSAYNAGKGAVKLFSKAIAIEFATKRTPIRVNSVHPGFIRTPLFDKGMQRMVDQGVAESIDDLVAVLSEATPNGRMGTPDEIANAIAFLASDDSSYMTGSEVVVDGGWTAQ